MSFHYDVDKVPKEYNSYLCHLAYGKLVLLYLDLLKVTELVEDSKCGLTVIVLKVLDLNYGKISGIANISQTTVSNPTELK